MGLGWQKRQPTNMKNSTPNIVYFAGLNLSGLWNRKPLKAKWNPEFEEWWGSDCSVRKLGLDDRGGFITFSSINKTEVQIWINGVLSSFRFLKNWIR